VEEVISGEEDDGELAAEAEPPASPGLLPFGRSTDHLDGKVVEGNAEKDGEDVEVEGGRRGEHAHAGHEEEERGD